MSAGAVDPVTGCEVCRRSLTPEELRFGVRLCEHCTRLRSRSSVQAGTGSAGATPDASYSCPACGAGTDNTFPFCFSCGAPVERQRVPPDGPGPETGIPDSVDDGVLECARCRRPLTSDDRRTGARTCRSCAESPWPILVLGGIAALILVSALFARLVHETPRDLGSNERRVSRSTFGGTWPFTVDEGVLACEPNQAVTFDADGETYAVNSRARELSRWLSARRIQAEDPLSSNGYVNSTDIINAGLELCE